MPNELSLKISNYKCFGDAPQGFEDVYPVNVIIGRNNSGKSTLLELLKYAVDPQFVFAKPQWRNSKTPPSVELQIPLAEERLKPQFSPNSSNGPISGNHWDFGKKYIGERITWREEASRPERNREFIAISKQISPSNPNQLEQLQHLFLQCAHNPMLGLKYRHLAAERNIQPEPDSNSINISPSGAGATTLIQQLLYKDVHDDRHIRGTLLDGINSVFAPDVEYSEIGCKQIQNTHAWEIYLTEQKKSAFPISQMGSGIKTVILVLLNLLLPDIEESSPDRFLFAFEELENNMHPALQRRLLTYLLQFAKKRKSLMFLTTHSNVAIDVFANSEDAQLIHVVNDGHAARVSKVKTRVAIGGVLDSLDVRASDLLQANGIVWVEGPSDRAYLNKWISLASDGVLQEGTHYQCVFYGGRLLAHLSATDSNLDDALKLFTVNRNAAVLMDSDKRQDHDSINKTKERIVREFQDADCIAWVTNGREIENYLPSKVIGKWLGKEVPTEIGQYQDIADYLNGIGVGLGDAYIRAKPATAQELIGHYEKSDLSPVLVAELEKLVTAIRRWNSM